MNKCLAARVARRRLSSTTSSAPAARAYCENLVKTRDYENYALAQLLPSRWPSGVGGGPRAAYVACRALNAEVASVRDAVAGNEATGKLRMQWWRDDIRRVVAEARGGSGGGPSSLAASAAETPLARPTHYVLRELREHLPHCALSERWLLRGVDAREADLIQPQHTVSDLESYSEATCSSQLYLALEALDMRGPQFRDGPSPWDAERLRCTLQAASHVGKAVGIVTALRGAFFVARESQTCALPRDPLETAGTTPRAAAEILVSEFDLNAVGSGGGGGGPRDPAALREAVFAIATVAHAHIEHAKELRSDVLPEAQLVLIAHAIVAQHLERLRQCDFELRDPRFLHVGNLAAQRALLWFTLFGGDGF